MSWVWHTKKPNDREPQWNAPLPPAGSGSNASRLEYLYAWERRCRGYELHPFPVALEPAFTPYAPDDFHADASALELLSGVRALPQATSPALCHIGLHLPLDQKVTAASSGGLLSILNNLHRPLAFEIIGSGRETAYQFSCSLLEADSVRTAARMQWPKAALELQGDRLAFGAASSSSSASSRLAANSFVVDFGLQSFAYLPLACFENFASDPLAGVVAGLGQVADGETAGLQVLLTPARAPWSASLLQVAGEFDDGSLAASQRDSRSSHRHPLESEAVRAAKAKLAHPLHAAVIRVFAFSPQGQGRAFELCKRIGGALGAFTNPQINEASGNQLIALSNNDPRDAHPHSIGINSLYPDNVHLEDVLRRQTHRSGMLLSLPELAGFVHPPSETLRHPKLIRLDLNGLSLPAHLLEAEGALLGIHRYRNQEQRLVWPDAYRNRHAYILGATRMGKSTLLLNMMCQDIEAGRGLCLIDPHGDLALDVLNRVPQERATDVLYLDLSDRDYPLALGLLEAQSEHEQRLLCSDVLSVLKRLFASSWGDRLEHILRHAILTLLAASQDQASTYTLRDIRALLSNKAFRERVVNQLSDPNLKTFWTSEFFGYSSSHFAPLYNKLGLLLSSPLVRNVIAQKQSRLSFGEVIENRQILLVNLASSRIGNDNAHFLGALLVSKLQIAAMGNLRFSQNQRTPFTLYVDEFQNFVVSSFETILSEAGKAGLSLVMANQFLEQLNGNLQTAILSNAGTLVSFRVSSDSGRLLEKEFAGRFKASELVSLNRGEAIARVGSAGDSFFMQTLPPPSQPHAHQSSPSLAAVIRDHSRKRVCRPRQEVETELAEEAAKQQADQEAEEWRESERKRIEAERKAEEKRREEQRKAELKAELKAQGTTHSRTPAQYPTAKKAPAKMQTAASPVQAASAAQPSAAAPDESPAPERKAEPITETKAVPEPPAEPEFFGVPDE